MEKLRVGDIIVIKTADGQELQRQIVMYYSHYAVIDPKFYQILLERLFIEEIEEYYRDSIIRVIPVESLNSWGD